MVLCYDGFMMDSNLYKPEILKELNNLIYDRLGLNIEFSQKPFESQFEQLISECTDKYRVKNALSDFNIQLLKEQQN